MPGGFQRPHFPSASSHPGGDRTPPHTSPQVEPGALPPIYSLPDPERSYPQANVFLSLQCAAHAASERVPALLEPSSRKLP